MGCQSAPKLEKKSIKKTKEQTSHDHKKNLKEILYSLARGVFFFVTLMRRWHMEENNE